MLLRTGWRLSGVLLAVWAASLVQAAEDQHPTFTDPAKAGPDYEVQGEYTGMLGDDEKHPWGAQVIALGDGKFELVGYKGGLPGAGWSRGDDMSRIEGVRTDGEVRFEKEDVAVVIRDGRAHVMHAGQDVGALEKVNRQSPTIGSAAPEGALVLFDGTSAEHFLNGMVVEGDLLAADCETKEKFQDFTLHLEFRTPFKPHARGQERGNSGVYAQNRYEIQVLDSFGLEGKNNECGGIYSIAEPIVNMCLPPLTWQTYDIDFTAARYDDQGNKSSNARITIKHNGVLIHDNLELPEGTPGKEPEGPEPAGLYLQGHGNPVVYRNIWVVKK